MEPDLTNLLAFFIGIGISAACGLRIFLPFLGLSIAAMHGFIHPGPGFQWLGTWPALIAFATATVFEIGAYYIPWLDNFLDTVATPAAVAAGTIASVSVAGDLPPFLKWSLALIAGGGVAGVVQTGTTLLRGAATATTGGTANFLLTTAEIFGSAFFTLLSLAVPVLAISVVMVLAAWILRRLLRPDNRPNTDN
ncbi:MAG TPA: DUF4126 domain-containing protein [Syntrophales bacterium]|jgi:hypothetical protein|nr:DUF4126 domain-containing protein [Syntrophales bacterium]HON22579.1 DUF4126 domain-containing protein [Syntrophales bacterium]HOU78596.1 DUF4126 domain-containing protein [Syntrophales bacterium]HPC32409.1 DUF4126 domain-containing protein [Syntrophales bacterium]HQG35235.1 DUF4126 domain-containing protein [Syntrophales bacterium]